MRRVRLDLRVLERWEESSGGGVENVEGVKGRAKKGNK
jgi:hypothetical protein